MTPPPMAASSLEAATSMSASLLPTELKPLENSDLPSLPGRQLASLASSLATDPQERTLGFLLNEHIDK